MNWLTSRRAGFFALFLACAGMMAFALYLQHYKFLNPCPLCMFQRVFVIAVGVLSLLAALHGGAPRLWGALIALTGLAGFSIAVRHTVLQYFPPDSLPSCGAGLFQMLDSAPFGQVVADVLRGTGECAVIDWKLLGLSLPGWTALGFAGLIAVALWLGFRARR
ncbi:disulfide bond formation protein B [Chitinimonas koreensis]|uniref:disulfide bond formation protein B n=1 Tax=Chitinimonas koreensis TaxID=356302 RepID=UPI000422C5FD|nr:disulfide bond formation protein B [Chitinimonas koreensis]QNM98333.1 disulfide bond formation protein B [Chitinimonas koreensis]